MKKVLFLLVSLALVLAACAPAAPAPASAGNGNLPMQTQTGNGAMMTAGTATPGAMTASNPAAAHMMEPITAPNIGAPSADQGGGKYAINANFSDSGSWKITVYVRKGDLDLKQELSLEIK